MKIAITGHRPEYFTSLRTPTGLDPLKWVDQALHEAVTVLSPSAFIVGMAAGVDILAACVAIDRNIPLIAARPWAQHRVNYHNLYDYILARAQEVVITNPAEHYPGPHVYAQRNEYMVNNADAVIAVWNGIAKGGTAGTVRYAKRQGKPVHWIDISKWEVMGKPLGGTVEPPPLEELSLFD